MIKTLTHTESQIPFLASSTCLLVPKHEVRPQTTVAPSHCTKAKISVSCWWHHQVSDSFASSRPHAFPSNHNIFGEKIVSGELWIFSLAETWNDHRGVIKTSIFLFQSVGETQLHPLSPGFYNLCQITDYISTLKSQHGPWFRCIRCYRILISEFFSLINEQRMNNKKGKERKWK